MSGYRFSVPRGHVRWLGCARGFTLVELMVAMLLGAVVIAGVISVFLTNQQVYRTNRGLSDVQASARIAFELMARDIRAAGLTGCGNSSRIANAINSGTTYWYTNWGTPVMGYTASQKDPASGTGGTERTTNTESLSLLGVDGVGYSVKANSEPAGTFTLNESSTPLKSGDITMVCDPDHAAIVQMTTVSGSTLTHAKSGTPGNCTNDLSYPTVCSSGSSYTYSANALVARLSAVDWYVATSAGGTSLYRMSLTTDDKGATIRTDEMVRNVTSLQFGYHLAGSASYLTADKVTNWANVDAIQINLTMVSTDSRAGVDSKAISRSFTSTTTLRNRVN
ncbi:PilW family protein [Dyella terrae]|uniref:PilW family protein n=1 Tax=Dyella terrae TaxID=522259 RepID=UPI001EFE4009|nr:PilW family protein [Dyella terrae]ULU27714.1 Prokaryotic N-terminal methylation protein [Dyella terrae]